MTYIELYEKATRQLEKSEITLGEYEEMVKPLDREVKAPPEWQQDHAIIKAHADGANEVVDRIKAAREKVAKGWYTRPANKYEEGKKDKALECMKILDKLIAEVEG